MLKTETTAAHIFLMYATESEAKFCLRNHAVAHKAL